MNAMANIKVDKRLRIQRVKTFNLKTLMPLSDQTTRTSRHFFLPCFTACHSHKGFIVHLHQPKLLYQLLQGIANGIDNVK